MTDLSYQQQFRAAAIQAAAAFHSGHDLAPRDVVETAEYFADYIRSGRDEEESA